jgi:hypothetical protein
MSRSSARWFSSLDGASSLALPSAWVVLDVRSSALRFSSLDGASSLALPSARCRSVRRLRR